MGDEAGERRGMDRRRFLRLAFVGLGVGAAAIKADVVQSASSDGGEWEGRRDRIMKAVHEAQEEPRFL